MIFCLKSKNLPKVIVDHQVFNDGSCYCETNALFMSLGYVQSRITAGKFTSVAVHRDQVFAAGYTKHKMVHVYKHSDNSWVKVHSFSVDLNGWITLSVKEQWICSSLIEAQQSFGPGHAYDELSQKE